MGDTQIQSAVPEKPADATAMREGDDGKMHFFNAAGTQGALAPDNIQKDDSEPSAQTPSAPGAAGKPLFDMSKAKMFSDAAAPQAAPAAPAAKPLFDMSKAKMFSEEPDPMRGASQATGLSPAKQSLWQRFRDFVQYGAPNGSFLAHESSKVMEHGPEKDMQLVSPDALMTAAEQDRHPMLDETGKMFGGLTTPQNVMMALGLGGAGKLPGLARPVVTLLTSAYFSAPVIQQAYEEVPEFKNAMLGDGKYADMSDEDRAHAAERILTRTVWGAAMLHEIGQHVGAEGEHLGGGDPQHLDDHGNPVNPAPVFGPQEQPPQDPLADRIVKGAAKKVSGVVSDAAAATGDMLYKSPETIGEAIGRTGSVVEAFKRASNIAPKQMVEHVKKLERVEEDLQAILNKYGNEINGPKDAADKINEHIHEQEDKLQAISGATKDDPEPVVPGIEAKIRADLDKFFDDNPQLYGSETEVRRAKAALMKKVLVETRNADGDIEYVEPNLLEAENTRRHLSPEVNYNPNAPRVTKAYEAGAARVTAKLREAIDQSYENKGVSDVKEWRTKEKDLIDIKKGLYDQQAKADKMGSGSVWQAMVKKIGATSTVIAYSLFSPAVIPIVAGEKIRQNFTNPNVNIQRAIELSKRNPGAKTVEPTIKPGIDPGPEPTPPTPTPSPTPTPPAPAPAPVPPPAPYVPAERYRPSEKAATMSQPTKDLGREFNADQATRELERNQSIINDKTGRATEEDKKIATQRIAENREIALEIAAKIQKATTTDHATNAELASHYNEVVGATPPADLEKRFLGDLEKKAADAQAQNKPMVLTPEEKDLLKKVNAAKARQNQTSDQQTQKSVEAFKKASDKAQQDAQKANEKAQQEKQAAAEKAKVEAEKADAEKKEKEEAGLTSTTAAPFTPTEHLTLPAKYQGMGLDGEDIAAHELGHQLMVAELGYSPEDIISHKHPQIPPGAAGQARWDPTPFHNDKGVVDLGIIKQKYQDMLDIAHAGPIAQEISSGIPMSSARGKQADMNKMAAILKAVGLSPVEAAQAMKASELRVRKVLTTPGVAEMIKRYTQYREHGLDEQYLMSPEALGAAIQEFKNVRGGGDATDSTTKTSGEGGSDDKGGDAGGAGRVSPANKKGPRPAGKARAGLGKRSGGSGGEAGAGDEKLKAARETLKTEMEKLKPETAELNETHPGVREASTGEPAEDAAIKEGGGIPGGFLDMEGYGRVKMFYEPEHAITLGFKPNEPVTTSAVKAKIAKARQDYGFDPVGRDSMADHDIQGELQKTREESRADRRHELTKDVEKAFNEKKGAQ